MAARADWTMMREHVGAADFPETRSNWRRLAQATGFEDVQELFVAPTDLFRMYAFRGGDEPGEPRRERVAARSSR